MGIKHTTQSAREDNVDYEMSADEWNEDHTIDGDVDFDNNESLKHRIENLASLPGATVAMIGRLVYRTSDKSLHIVIPT